MGKAFRLGQIAAFGAAMGMLTWGAEARASLTPSEADQVRQEVSTAQNVGRVRSLIARPDLGGEEAAATMAAAMSMTPIDAPHAAFLHELVFGAASAASRPMLAVAVVRGALARANSLMAVHQTDLDRHAPALAEIARAYDLVEDVVSADDRANVTDSARAECGKALRDHVAHNPTVLRPDAPVAPSVASLRAQAAIALFDALPDTPARRVDLANALALGNARRAALIELGILVLDAGGSESRVTAIRTLLDRMPGAADGVEAIVVGDERASRLRARGGAVIPIEATPPGPLSESSSPWGNETAPPPVDASTMAAARGLAAAAVRRAMERKPALRAAVERDGGEAGVATVAGMLVVDAQRTFDAAAARLLVGKRESAAWLSDAVGALAAFSVPSKGQDGLSVSFGRPDSGLVETVKGTRVTLDPSGAATSLRLEGHAWRIQRDDRGLVVGFSRDAAPVSAKTLASARPPAAEASSWSAAGLVFARLSGAPRAAVAAGPHVWIYGSGVSDAIAAPAPGDDVAVEADVRADGGPAGIVLRALPGSGGAFGPFKGISLLIVPGAPSHAALLVADGTGVETAAAPVVELASAPTQHVRMTVKGGKLEAKVGTTTLAVPLPEGFEHGDVALRAYPGASLEASAWKVKKL